MNPPNKGQNRETRRARGLCAYCDKPSGRFWLCLEHRQRQEARRAVRRVIAKLGTEPAGMVSAGHELLIKITYENRVEYLNQNGEVLFSGVPG